MSAREDLQLVVPDADGRERFADLLAHSFGFPRADAPAWLAMVGHENLRVLTRGRAQIGGLCEVPMGQWFGGRSVSTLGVAGVALSPVERGRGVGARMILAMLREARARGFALSTLYPASYVFYRRAGYERAGVYVTVSFDPRTLEVARVPEMTIAEAPSLPDEAKALYGRIARASNGMLDRGPYVWSRVERPRGLSARAFVVAHRAVLEGHVVFAHTRSDAAGENAIVVTDLCATTERAARAILRLLAEYRSLATRVEYRCGLSDILTTLLPERHYEMKVSEHFMLRVVDVGRAFAMRGWPTWASGALAFEVTDGSMPENTGRYGVTVAGGEAHVAISGGRRRRAAGEGPVVTIGERGLAALYSGGTPPRILAQAGLLEAGEEALIRLEQWFGGPAPALRDFF